jgi:hypothetical protein
METNQDDSDWKNEAKKNEADMWAIKEGVDGEMINWIWEIANSKKEFYDLCNEELKHRPVCNYTPEMGEIICSILNSEPRLFNTK